MTKDEPPWKTTNIAVKGKPSPTQMIALGIVLLVTGSGITAVGNALSNGITVLVGILLLIGGAVECGAVAFFGELLAYVKFDKGNDE